METQAQEAVGVRVGRALRRSFFSAGTAYGLLFGLLFALVTWGYDGLLLQRSGADMPWAKLTLGLPLSALAGILMGFLGALVDRAWFSALLGGGVGCFLSLLAGHLPYEGASRVIGWTSPLFAGLPIFPFGPSAVARMDMTLLAGIVIGALVGALQSWAVDRAWDYSTPGRHMSLRSWLVLTISVPLFLPLALVVEFAIDQPVRHPQTLVNTLVQLVAAGDKEGLARRELNDRPLRPFLTMLSPNVTTYLVDYDLEALYDASVDVVMDNGLALRCSIGGQMVYSCTDLSSSYSAWMDNLVNAGRTGEQRWLDGKVRTQDVRPDVVAWLLAHADQLQGSYQVRRVAQRGGWLFLSARFESGFEMVCRMSGARPEVVDWCGEGLTR